MARFMKLDSKVIVLSGCLFMAFDAWAGTSRPASWNYTLMGIGGAAVAFGLVGLLATSIACPPALAIAVLITGAVSVGIGSIDEIHEVVADTPPKSSFASEAESWKDVDEQIQRQLDNDTGDRRKSIGSWFRDLFGSKPANAGELEPLQPIDKFIAENSSEKIRNRDKNRKKDSPKRERRQKSHSQPSQPEATGRQPDLHSLNLDDPNGDWCKCAEPGCSANMEANERGYVLFGCTKCKKVNVKYAKMALELEQRMKDAGVASQWHGQNAEANAHRAASAK